MQPFIMAAIRCLLPAVMLVLSSPAGEASAADSADVPLGLRGAAASGTGQPVTEDRTVSSVSGTGTSTTRPETNGEEPHPGKTPSPPLLLKTQEGGEENAVTIVDVVHAEISRSIQGTAAWMDSFFGNRRYESELNQSYIRFRYNVFVEEDSKTVRKPDFQVRFVLPQLRERTHLVFAGAARDVREFSALDSGTDREDAPPSDERNVSAAVQQTFVDTTQQSFTTRAGLQLHKGKPALMLGPRYRILIPLATWNLRFIEEVVWRSNAGWESRFTGDLERPLPNGLFFRASNDWLWTEHVDGYLYAFTFYVGQPLNHSRGLEYEWVNAFHTQPINELAEVTLRARYRQQFWRDWLFFELSPQLRFPRDRGFRATPGIVFRLDMIFGHYDGYAP